MRNLKKILALVLALVMSMSLVTIANASDFTDADDITYEEAADVMSTIGVIEGFEDGSFDPDGTLTREQAAKLVTYMLLGDNANRLGIERSTFNDVAMTRWSAPAIEYCVSLGIIDGAGDGNFYPAGTLTGAAFAKVLLTALGYDSEIEGLTGATWSVNTAALAMEVGLDSGIEDLSWSSALTREEAAQMALNAIKAPLVAYEGGTSITVNGAEVSIGSGDAYYITSTLAREQRISEEQLTNSNLYTVEFGERYFPNLRLNQETDEFERPSYTWVYENTELGTYVNYDMLEETYTEDVTGRDLFELLGRSTIDKYDLTYYVDGEVNNTITATSMNRGNTSEYSTTGNGVLTQVFIDHDTEEIIITSINTYLAQANADYNKNNETLSLNVFLTDSTGTTRTVDSADVPNAVDVTEDQFVLVNMSGKDRTRLEVVKISDVEIMSDVTITKFSTAGNSDKVPSIFTKLTADGTEYKASQMALYDDDFLNLYDASLLTDMSYNVYLDQYGYAIGVDLFEGDLNYVFITGYDRGKSHISIKTAEAGAIFLDGSMTDITVNVTNTNKNIDKVTDRYYKEWSGSGDVDLNRWYTYTVDSNDVYTLKPVEGKMIVTDLSGSLPDKINCSNVRVEDDYFSNGRAYGNDDSVYITVEAGSVDMSGNNGKDEDAIVDVLGLYTGVQSVDIEITSRLQGDITEGNIYTLKDGDDYIIASIVLGEAQGSTSNYAYILTNATSEGVEDGVYSWTFDAILGGEKVTLTARSKYPNTISDLEKDTVQELRMDGDYVVGVRDIDPEKFIEHYYDKWDDEEVYFVNYSGETVELKGRTFQSSGAEDQGWTIISTSMPTVLRQIVNGKSTTTNYGSMSEALSAVGDANTNTAGLQFRGKIVTVMNSQGVAEWAFIDSLTPVTTGSGVPSGGSDEYYTYTANIFSNGLARLSLTADRPDWLTTTSRLGYEFDVLVNGVLYAHMASGETGYTAIQPDEDKATSTWTNTMWLPLDPGDKITVDNFQWTNLSAQTYVVKYIDQNGRELTTTGSNSDLLSTSDTTLSPSGDTIDFTLNTAKYDVNASVSYTGRADYKVINAYKAGPLAESGKTSAATGTATTANLFAGTFDANGTYALEGYVYVQIEIADLNTKAPTYRVIEGNSMTNAEKTAIGHPSGSATKMVDLGISGANTDTLAIAVDKVSVLKEYDVVTFTATIIDGNDNVAYNVTIKTDAGDVTIDSTGKGYLTMPAGDVTIEGIDVSVAAPLLAVRNATVEGNVMTIRFNTGVDQRNAGNDKFDSTEFDDTRDAKSRHRDIVTVEHAAEGDTITITLSSKFNTDDKIVLDTGAAVNAADENDKLGAVTFEVQADGSVKVTP